MRKIQRLNRFISHHNICWIQTLRAQHENYTMGHIFTIYQSGTCESFPFFFLMLQLNFVIIKFIRFGLSMSLSLSSLSFCVVTIERLGILLRNWWLFINWMNVINRLNCYNGLMKPMCVTIYCQNSHFD